MEDNEFELYDNMSDEHNNESLHEDYISVTKPHTINKVWVHFGLKCNKDGLLTHWRLRSQFAATATRLSQQNDQILPICLPIYKTITLKYMQNWQQPRSKLISQHLLIERGKKYEVSSIQAKELHYAVAYFTAKNGQSFYTIGKQDFKTW